MMAAKVGGMPDLKEQPTRGGGGGSNDGRRRASGNQGCGGWIQRWALPSWRGPTTRPGSSGATSEALEQDGLTTNEGRLSGSDGEGGLIWQSRPEMVRVGLAVEGSGQRRLTTSRARGTRAQGGGLRSGGGDAPTTDGDDGV
jgi:hypothetical protein